MSSRAARRAHHACPAPDRRHGRGRPGQYEPAL